METSCRALSTVQGMFRMDREKTARSPGEERRGEDRGRGGKERRRRVVAMGEMKRQERKRGEERRGREKGTGKEKRGERWRGREDRRQEERKGGEEGRREVHLN